MEKCHRPIYGTPAAKGLKITRMTSLVNDIKSINNLRFCFYLFLQLIFVRYAQEDVVLIIKIVRSII